WPATRGAKTLDWTVPDVTTDDLYRKYGTQSLLAECREAVILVDRYGTWCEQSRYDERDNVNCKVFDLILEKHHPNLALLHLINVAHVPHLKGPQTREAYAAIKEADAHVKDVWDRLKRDHLGGGATLLIVSDHGFVPIRQSIFFNVILHKAGLTDVKGTKV